MTLGYLVVTGGNLVVTSGKLIATTGYFTLLPNTFCYFLLLASHFNSNNLGGHNSKITEHDYICLRVFYNLISISTNEKDSTNALERNEKYSARLTKHQGQELA